MSIAVLQVDPGGWKLRWSARGSIETKTQPIPAGPPVPSFIVPVPLSLLP